MNNAAGLFFISFVLRIIGLFVCKNKAKELNRDSSVWGFWGFLSPIISMIWINSLKHKTLFKNSNEIKMTEKIIKLHTETNYKEWKKKLIEKNNDYIFMSEEGLRKMFLSENTETENVFTIGKTEVTFESWLSDLIKKDRAYKYMPKKDLSVRFEEFLKKRELNNPIVKNDDSSIKKAINLQNKKSDNKYNIHLGEEIDEDDDIVFEEIKKEEEESLIDNSKIETKLKNIKYLFEQKLISEEDYINSKKEILKNYLQQGL